MSSRFDQGWDEEGAISAGLWHHNLYRSMAGKQGQKTLKELAAALEALPQKRLISGTLSDGTDVCAIGALAAYSHVKEGQSWAEAIKAEDTDDFDSPSMTAYRGQDFGFSWTVAWTIAELNDEDYRALSPELRYERVLAWVREQIATEEAA